MARRKNESDLADLLSMSLATVAECADPDRDLPLKVTDPSAREWEINTAVVTAARREGETWDGLSVKLLAKSGHVVNRVLPPGLVRFCPWPGDWERHRHNANQCLVAMPLWLAQEKGIV